MRKWVPKGSKPKVKSAPGRKSVAYIGYVVPSTGKLIVTKPSWFNYKTVIQSFRDFIQRYSTQKRIFFVLDNAPWHKKAVRLVQSWKFIVTHNGCTDEYDCKCSKCGKSDVPSDRYCSYCGAKMINTDSFDF